MREEWLPAGGLIILLLGCLFALLRPPVSRAEEERNVRSFGATGDGQSDDTDALQRAIESGCGDIRFPRGVYRLSRPLRIELDKVGFTTLHGNGVAVLRMAGAGPAVRIVGTHLQSADPEGFADGVWERQRMPMIDGLAIVGEHPEASGIAAEGTMQCTITRVHLRRLLHGIQLTNNNRNVIVSDCHIYDNRGVGILYDNVNLHQSIITGCHISYNAGGGVVSRGGNVRNLHITGCDLESNMQPDRPATANVFIDCGGSTYGTGEVAITGCTIQHNNPSPDSANIRIFGRSNPGPRQEVVREGNVTITGNVLSDVQVNIHLRDCRGVTIVGNTFWQGYAHNLLIERCASIVAGPNNFDRNPRYDYGNTQDANNGLVFRDSEDCTLSGLHVTNVWREPAGLLLENCRRFNVTDCTILDCDQRGLWLNNVRDSRVSDCLIRDDRPGSTSRSLEVSGGNGNLIRGNLLGTAPSADERAAVLHDNVYP